MSKEIVATKKQQNTSIETMITHALDKGTPIEVMERLFAMRKEFLAEQAKSAYLEALASFQEDVPIIEKSKKVLNKDGRTVRYVYAPIESIVKQIQKPLAKAKISYRWEVTQDGKDIKATCIITHTLGHSEQSSFSVSIDSEGFMTAPQKAASALTFAKRYSLLNALGISTGDEDTDATDVKTEPNAKSDKSKIIFLLRTLGKDTSTKEGIEKAVKDTVHFDLKESNYKKIVEHLELEVRTKNNENPTIR